VRERDAHQYICRHGSTPICLEADRQARRAVHVQRLAPLPWLIAGEFEIP